MIEPGAGGGAFAVLKGATLAYWRRPSPSAGAPILLFETGSGADASVWRPVIAALGHEFGWIAYDRAGLGASPPALGARDPATCAHQALAMLDWLQVKEPVIVVAHSIGTLIARCAALAAPGRICGLVLIDAVHEDMYERLCGGGGATPRLRLSRAMRMMHGLEWAGRLGLIGILLRAGAGSMAGMQLSLRSDAARIFSSPGFYREIRRSAAGFDQSASHIRGRFIAAPLSVLTGVGSGNQMRQICGLPEDGFVELWRGMHLEIAANSAAGMQIDVEAGHNIHLDAPQAVVSAIRAVAQAVNPEARRAI